MRCFDVDRVENRTEHSISALSFRPADPADIGSVAQLFREAIAAMQQQGIDQWDDLYPTRKHLEEDCEERALWLVEDENRLIASVTLNERPAVEYGGILWGQSGRVLYVHRLCVDPGQQGRGVARAIMLWVEQFAEIQKYDVIRLDTYVGNLRALRLYRGLGYEYVAEMTSRKGLFPCFEKTVTSRQVPDR
jgi:ribosomal protein S18 acetylase RimI-like enzyme